MTRPVSWAPACSHGSGGLALGRLGGWARLAYIAASGQVYLQRALNLDVIGLQSGAVREAGNGPLALAQASASQISFAATPLARSWRQPGI